MQLGWLTLCQLEPIFAWSLLEGICAIMRVYLVLQTRLQDPG